jgi:L-arabinokinase
MNVGYYITGHGLGHATRSLGIIQSLLKYGFKVTIVSGIDCNFFLNSLIDLEFECYQRYLDTGAIQNGPLIVDAAATLESFYTNIHLNRESLIASEIIFLKQNDINMIISDATSIICKAAKLASIPAVIISNFTWNYCYSRMLESINVNESLNLEQKKNYLEMIEMCEEDYSLAGMYIRLPGSTPLSEKLSSGIIKVVQGPLACRRATKSREEVKQELGIDFNKHVVVLGFGGFKRSDEWMLADGSLPSNWVCVVLGASSTSTMPSSRFIGVSFDYFIPDLINAADAVIGKLGYGTMSECLAHGTPLLYVPRSSWPEEKYLEKFIQSFDAGILLPEKDFLNGQWNSYLEDSLLKKKNYNNYDTNGECNDWNEKNFQSKFANDKVVEILRNLKNL